MEPSQAATHTRTHTAPLSLSLALHLSSSVSLSLVFYFPKGKKCLDSNAKCEEELQMPDLVMKIVAFDGENSNNLRIILCIYHHEPLFYLFFNNTYVAKVTYS